MAQKHHQNTDNFIPEYERETDISEFSSIAQEIIRNRENMGSLIEPDLIGKVRGCCGDCIQIELQLNGDIIEEARYTTDGCSATVAVGGMITRLITQKTLHQALNLSPQDIIDALEGLPKGHNHCADLAIKTLQKTLEARFDEPLSQ
jgi:nitrogen fixation NifU-like protein